MTTDAFGLRTGPRRPPPAAPEEGRRTLVPAFLTSGESWLTFVFLLTAFMAVVFSIESANWTAEMPSLIVAGLAGLLTGWLLAHAPLPPLPVYAGGIVSGLVVVFGQTMHTMRLEDPLLHGGVAGRWGELWARVGDWVQALVGGGISNDALPFVLLIVFGVWGMSYLAAWAVFRLHNAWLALIPAGVALLTNISYLPGQPSAEFIIYLFASILLVTRMHYLRAMRQWRAQRTWRTPYLSFEVLNFATWVGLALILAAWIVPTANNWGPVSSLWGELLQPVTERVDRVGRVFVGISAKRGRHLHGFADTLPLQGKITLDDETVLMQVTAPEPFYLRAAVYDEYTAQGWKISEAGTRPMLGTSVEAASFGTAETRAQLRRPVAAEISVEQSVASRRLFVLGEPLAADVEALLLTGAAAEDVIGMVPHDRVGGGDRYSTVGTVSAAPVERLLQSGREYPQWVRDRYLQLPSDLSPRVGELARQVAGGLEQPFAAARALELFLHERYPYDLDIPSPPPRADGVTYFLFEAKRGYFDHHASAMAVMLRTLGIPARVATGFALDEADLDAATKAYAVTEKRAWAWPEVYFEGLGWVEFNPTPSQPVSSRPGSELDLSDLLPTEAELLDDVALRELIDERADVGFEVEDQAAGGARGAGDLLAAALTWLTVLAMVLVAAWVALRGFWAYRFRGLPPAVARWAKLQQLAAWAGLPLQVNRTPLESAAQLSDALGERLDLRPLARAYTVARYGAPGRGQGDDGEEERLETLYGEARARLVRLVLRRASPRRAALASRQPTARLR